MPFVVFVHICNRTGKHLVKIDKCFPSKKMWSNCGNRKEMSLAEITYKCSFRLTISRDYKTAFNIKKEAIKSNAGNNFANLLN